MCGCCSWCSLGGHLFFVVVGEGAFVVVVVIVGGGDLVGVFGADNALEAS